MPVAAVKKKRDELTRWTDFVPNHLARHVAVKSSITGFTPCRSGGRGDTGV